MANAFIEPTDDGRYQVEVPGQVNDGPYPTQREAIERARQAGHTPLVARVRHRNDKNIPDHWRAAD